MSRKVRQGPNIQPLGKGEGFILASTHNFRVDAPVKGLLTVYRIALDKTEGGFNMPKAMVLEQFNKPLVETEYPLPKLGQGEMLVKLEASGVCGSDVHMWRGKDPRTPLPLILGHEGVGRVVEVGQTRTDIYGQPLRPDDLVIWDRGVTCNSCYYCAVKKEPSLCVNRKVYGINVSCKDAPHFRGCYAEYLVLFEGTKVLKIPDDVAPEVLVAASCSGATSAHTHQLCGITEGDSVVIQGPGPVGLFALAFALDSGAATTIVIGVQGDEMRLKLAEDFGATHTLNVSDTTEEERRGFVMAHTGGHGADVVIDTTGSPKALAEGMRLTAKGGTYALPGVAVPIGQVPISFYEDVALKNLRIQGVWVSDTQHLYQAVKLVLSGRYPFDKLVTHKFDLEEATLAMETMERKEAIKAVLRP